MDNLILAAFVLSGAAGVAYEILWTRALSVLVGGTALASQAVLATFFAGTTAGAFILGARVARDRRPGDPTTGRAQGGARSYALLELGIAAAGLLSLVTLAVGPEPIAALTDGTEGARSAAVSLVATAAVCLPATFLMGATFPAATRALQEFRQLRQPGDPARLLGLAYAANTGGAVLGGLLCVFVFLPALGVRNTLLCTIALNVLAAALTAIAARTRHERAPAPKAEPRSADRPAGSWRLALAALASGIAGISLQIVALRVLAVTLNDTVYTFALAITAYIAGAATGALVYSRVAVRNPAACGAGHWGAAPVFAVAIMGSSLWLLTLPSAETVAVLVAGNPSSFLAHVLGEATVALLFAFPIAIPTTWALLSCARSFQPRNPAAAAGWVTAWNGIGCALAPIISTLILLPRFGSFGVALFAVATLFAATILLFFHPTGTAGHEESSARPLRRDRLLWSGAALLLPLAALSWRAQDGLFPWLAAPGYTLLWRHEGASIAVAVEQSPTGQRRLRTNNHFTEGGDGGNPIQLRQGMLPTLFRPQAQRVLVMGVGSGGTLAGAAAGLPEARIDAVELLPEVTRALGFFDNLHGGVQRNPLIALHVADARAFAAHAGRTDSGGYDLVIGELFHAQQAGSGALYAADHFANIKRALSPHGLYVQWLPLHETPPDITPVIIRTFFGVFPEGGAFLGTWNLKTPILGLFGAAGPLQINVTDTARWLASNPLRARRARESIIDDLPDTLATFVGSAENLRRFAGAGPHNSDDRPEMELFAPRGMGIDLGILNLLRLNPIRRPPDAMIDDAPPATRARIAAIQSASGRFFIGTDAWRRNDIESAERELRAALATAPEFAPARRALIDLAQLWDSLGKPERGQALRQLVEEAASP